ncbi:MAG: hypothetical protein ACI4M6_03965 [Christensenellaceae bacterium]
MIKVFCGFLIFAVSTLIGVKLSQRERERLEIFSALSMLCESLSQDVYFKIGVVEKLKNLDYPLKGVLACASDDLKSGKQFCCNEKLLSQSENKTVSDFINQLGMYDENGSLSWLKLYKERFTSMYNAQLKVWDTAKKTYVRLGAFAGAVAFIIMV